MRTKIKVEVKLAKKLDVVIEQLKKVMQNEVINITQASFMFNGIKCVVNQNTNTENLVRDYHNTKFMSWKKIGPEPVEYYDKKNTRAY